MPLTTPIPKDTANIRSQNRESAMNTGRLVRRYAASRKAMNDASPMVKAGKRMCHPTTQANCIRDKKSGSRRAIRFPENANGLPH